MTVPSYDSQLTLFMRNDLKILNRRTGDQEELSKKNSPDLLASCSKASLFACLRQTSHSELQTANCELPAFAEASARQALMAIARDFSPRVMVASECEVLLDVSGLGRLIGEPPAIAAALARALFDAGLEASVALAPTQTVARLLATQAPNCPATFLPHLPVTLLQPLESLPPAMNHRDRARSYQTRDAERLYKILDRWGIHTLGDLVALPAAELSSRLGRRGVALQRLARGLDPRPFVPDGDTPRYIGRLELEWPLEALEPLSFVFARLLEPLSVALERADRGAAAIRLDLRLTTRATHTRLLQLPAPMRDPKVLRTLLLLDLESHLPFGGASEGRREPPRSGGSSAQRGGGGAPPSEVMIDAVSIELDPAPARITQFSLLERALPSPETLSTLTARLSALVGEARIGSAVLLDSHQPGAFEMARFAPESRAISSRRSDEVAKADALLRRQRVPPAIRVSVEHGRPVYIAASKHSMPQGAVMQAAGPWRTSGGWWAQGGNHEICPWSRDEWDVALTSGTVCRIFQDRTTERWFLDGTYD